MSFQGMDVDQVRDLAQRMTTAQQRLSEQHDVIRARMAAIPEIWRGGDAEDFRNRWESQVSPAWRSALELLLQKTESATTHADEQDAASDADGAGPGSGGTQRVREITDEEAGDVPVDPEVQDAWRAMEPEQQQAVLQEMVDEEFERYGMDPEEIQWFYEEPDPDTNLVTFGSWSEDDQVLKMNEHLLDQPGLMLTTVHEVRHAAQYEFIEQTEPEFWDFLPWNDSQAGDYEAIEDEHGVTREEIEAWRENFDGDNYKSTDKGDTFEEYQSQPVEVDAREREDEFAGEELTMEQLKQYQADAGVPVSE